MTLGNPSLSSSSRECSSVKPVFSEYGREQFNWLGRIRYTRSVGGVWYPCSGVAITRRHVLVPAHCVLFLDRGDAYSFMVGNRRHAITRIFIHPEYRLELPSYDIAVLELNSQLRSCLAVSEDTDSEETGSYALIARLLDVVSTVVGKHPKNLHTVAKVTGHKYCRRKYEDFKLSHNEVCAYIHQDKDFLNGAALLGVKVVNGSEAWRLLGISTHGPYERTPEIPDLFTLISPFNKWIGNILSL
ncbi:plasma kallikrein [Drosophila erecta]|uniref:plasma kallikrein n=1 Tax=Drosophila erecta TaxID=7220 RepID=UPI000F06E433|nr:plasma kallikrein [Drosophila erecta]